MGGATSQAVIFTLAPIAGTQQGAQRGRIEFARGELQQTQRSLHEAAVSERHAEREVVWTRWTVRIGCIEMRAQHFIENALHSRTPRLKIGNDDGDATLWIIKIGRAHV